MKKFQHPLMENNFTKSDINAVIMLLKKKNVVLTQSTNVLKFEKAWSKWLGVKYSVFVVKRKKDFWTAVSFSRYNIK